MTMSIRLLAQLLGDVPLPDAYSPTSYLLADIQGANPCERTLAMIDVALRRYPELNEHPCVFLLPEFGLHSVEFDAIYQALPHTRAVDLFMYGSVALSMALNRIQHHLSTSEHVMVVAVTTPLPQNPASVQSEALCIAHVSPASGTRRVADVRHSRWRPYTEGSGPELLAQQLQRWENVDITHVLNYPLHTRSDAAQFTRFWYEAPLLSSTQLLGKQHCDGESGAVEQLLRWVELQLMPASAGHILQLARNTLGWYSAVLWEHQATEPHHRKGIPVYG
ncbi:hypothetical protein ACKC9G_12895 [Pokkaliibacter sp. CJK22405]|uniref:hypothetical protein n=1 Tax=Pokkaliibacter sp. CJK22405 TaxID=3384615 RepID=UPI003984B8D0